MEIRRILLISLAVSVLASGFWLRGGDSAPVTKASEQPASLTSSPVSLPSQNSKETAREVNMGGQQPAPPPPPPPPSPPAGTRDGRISKSPPEKPRMLIGPTRAQLKRVEQALPRESSVYIGPVGLELETAALAEADLNGDGVAETIVVHTERQATALEQRPPLMLSILSRLGKRFSVQMSISLLGSILFNIDAGEGLLPIVVQDITGDGKPEIVLAPGLSASLGAWLEAYDVDGKHFRRVAHINGRYFRFRSPVGDRPFLITSRWMEEDEENLYKWNGTEFQNISVPRSLR